MRVLMFNSNISRNSGVLSVIMNYYRNIDRNNLQFDFLYFRPSESSYEDEIKSLGGQCYIISSPSNMKLFKRDLTVFFDQHKNEYPIVQIHDAIFARFMYRIIKNSGVKNVIVHSHATKYSDKIISEIRNAVLCHNITSYGDTMFACSKAAGQFMFKGRDYYLMNNAIDSDKYKYSEETRNRVRKQLCIEEKKVVGHIGAFVQQKNHTFLLSIFKELLNQDRDYVLMLVGDGPLLDKIKRESQELGIADKVMFLGKRTDAQDLYQAMDVFALPSLYEGLPMVGVEAQCAGLPVVFSSEITQEVGIGVYKYLSLKEDAKVWASVIHDLYCENKASDRNFGAENIKNNNFEVRIEADKLLGKYREILR